MQSIASELTFTKKNDKDTFSINKEKNAISLSLRNQNLIVKIASSFKIKWITTSSNISQLARRLKIYVYLSFIYEIMTYALKYIKLYLKQHASLKLT